MSYHSRDDPSVIGIMEGAFFVSRKELIDWLNTQFLLSVDKVEQCASGAIYIQIIDSIFPGKVPIQKVNWNAKLEYEFIQNYKILQEVFTKLGVNKYIEVEKLIKGKYLDNLEFLQWIKAFWDRQYMNGSVSNNYNPVERRKLSGGILPSWSEPSKKSSTNNSDQSKSYKSHHSSNNSKGNLSNIRRLSDNGNTMNKTELKSSLNYSTKPTSILNLKSLPESKQISLLSTKLKEKETELNEVNELLYERQIERDFYYSKLREIECLCQIPNTTSLDVIQLQNILYATDVNDELLYNSGSPSKNEIDQQVIDSEPITTKVKSDDQIVNNTGMENNDVLSSSGPIDAAILQDT